MGRAQLDRVDHRHPSIAPPPGTPTCPPRERSRPDPATADRRVSEVRSIVSAAIGDEPAHVVDVVAAGGDGDDVGVRGTSSICGRPPVARCAATLRKIGRPEQVASMSFIRASGDLIR